MLLSKCCCIPLSFSCVVSMPQATVLKVLLEPLVDLLSEIYAFAHRVTFEVARRCLSLTCPHSSTSTHTHTHNAWGRMMSFSVVIRQPHCLSHVNLFIPFQFSGGVYYHITTLQLFSALAQWLLSVGWALRVKQGGVCSANRLTWLLHFQHLVQGEVVPTRGSVGMDQAH